MDEKRIVPLLALALFSLLAQRAQGQLSQPHNPYVQGHISELIASLPPGNRVREAMERGDRGDGVHYLWMDGMRREGVKRALVRTEFVWRGKPTEVRLSRIVYFSKYDTSCAQISDPQPLSQIRTSGLEEELGKVAVQRTLKAHWLLIHMRHRTKHGVGTIELLDDEWLPRLPDTLAPTPKTPPSRFQEAIDMGDMAEVTSLLQVGVSSQERDGALGAALANSDPCMTRAFLSAGANPNLRDRDGFTLLMIAVRYKSFQNVKTLLAAGADVNARANNGQTALSIARQEHDEQIVDLLTQSGTRD